jgi:hypothetical protein
MVVEDVVCRVVNFQGTLGSASLPNMKEKPEENEPA